MNKPSNKEKLKAEIEKLWKEGDYEALENLIERNQNRVRNKQYIIEEFTRQQILGYQEDADFFMEISKNCNEDPNIWNILTMEIFLRAIEKDYSKFAKIQKKFPGRQFLEAMKILASENDDDDDLPSFKVDINLARNMFTTFYENYLEITIYLASMVSIIANDKEKINKNNVKKYLENFEEGRYIPLLLNDSERRIRNSISHHDIYKKEDKLIIGGKQGSLRKYSLEELDRRLHMLVLRMQSVLMAFSAMNTLQLKFVIGKFRIRG